MLVLLLFPLISFARKIPCVDHLFFITLNKTPLEEDEAVMN